MVCVNLGSLSRAIIGSAAADGCAGATPAWLPRAAAGGCSVFVLNTAGRDVLVPKNPPAPIFLGLALPSVGFPFSPTLAGENNAEGARLLWSHFTADGRGTWADTGEGRLAGDLPYILGGVLVASNFPEAAALTFVANRVRTGTGVGVSVLTTGLGTMVTNSKCLVRSGFIEVGGTGAALARRVTPEEAVLPAAKPLPSLPAGNTEKADTVLGTNGTCDGSLWSDSVLS